MDRPTQHIKYLGQLFIPIHKIHSIDISPLGHHLAVGSMSYLHLYSAQGRLRQRKHSSRGVKFTPDGQFLVSKTIYGSLHIWNPNTFQEIACLNENLGGALRFSSDSQLLAQGTHKHISLRQIPSLKEVLRLESGDLPLDFAFFADNQKLVSSGIDNTLRVWDLSSGKEIYNLSYPFFMGGLTLSPNRQFLAFASLIEEPFKDLSSISVLDLNTLQITATVEGDKAQADDWAFVGENLITCNEQGLTLWKPYPDIFLIPLHTEPTWAHILSVLPHPVQPIYSSKHQSYTLFTSSNYDLKLWRITHIP